MAFAAGLAVAAGDAADDALAVAGAGLRDEASVGTEDVGAVIRRAAGRRDAAIGAAGAEAARRGRALGDRDQAEAVDAGAADIADEAAIRYAGAAMAKTGRTAADDAEAVDLTEPRNVRREDALLMGIFAM